MLYLAKKCQNIQFSDDIVFNLIHVVFLRGILDSPDLLITVPESSIPLFPVFPLSRSGLGHFEGGPPLGQGGREGNHRVGRERCMGKKL